MVLGFQTWTGQEELEKETLYIETGQYHNTTYLTGLKRTQYGTGDI